MSVREITARLSHAKADLQRLPQLGQLASAALTEAAAIVNSVLDDVADKALAGAIGQQGKRIKRAYQAPLAAVRDIDATITRFRSIGGR